MALSGNFTGTTGNNGTKCKIYWSATQDKNGNFSNVTATLYYWKTNNYTTYGSWSGGITINGNRVAGTKSLSIKTSEVEAMSATVKVPHNADGAKSITISADGSISGTSLSSTSISGNITLDTIPRASVWTEMPFRWYINAENGGLRNLSQVPAGKNYLQVKYDKKGAKSNNIWLAYNGDWGTELKPRPEKSPYNLHVSDDGYSIYQALRGIQDKGAYYWAPNNNQYAQSKYYDTRILLRSYSDTNRINKLGEDSINDIRVEITSPRLPTGLKVDYNSQEDWSYKSGKFKVSWNKADFCSHYVIKYEVYQQNNSNVVKSKSGEIEVAGHDTTSTEIIINNLLAGQVVLFYITGRWKYTANNTTFSFDTNAWSPAFRIQKQGGMIAKTSEGYKNCHIYVTDENGKKYKADAAYIYTYKDGSTTELEYRLLKMQ